jgi:hypothetical protein
MTREKMVAVSDGEPESQADERAGITAGILAAR